MCIFRPQFHISFTDLYNIQESKDKSCRGGRGPKSQFRPKFSAYTTNLPKIISVAEEIPPSFLGSVTNLSLLLLSSFHSSAAPRPSSRTLSTILRVRIMNYCLVVVITTTQLQQISCVVGFGIKVTLNTTPSNPTETKQWVHAVSDKHIITTKYQNNSHRTRLSYKETTIISKTILILP